MGCRLGSLCGAGGIWGSDDVLARGDAVGSLGMVAIPAAEGGEAVLGLWEIIACCSVYKSVLRK